MIRRMRGFAVTLGAIALIACGGATTPSASTTSPSAPSATPKSANEREVLELVQAVEDALARDGGAPNGPETRRTAATSAQRLVEACTAPETSAATRTQILRALASAREPGGEPCFVYALQAYRIDDTNDDVRIAARAVETMKLLGARPAVLALFERFEAGQDKTKTLYRPVHDVVLAMQDTSFEQAYLAKLAQPIDQAGSARALKSALMWQITAAEGLGHLASARAAVPLLAAVADPAKSDVAATAVHALLRIGAPARDAARARLDAPGLTATDRRVAVLVLAVSGRHDAAKHVLRALAETREDRIRAQMALDVQHLPPSAEVSAALRTAFERTPPRTALESGADAREEILAAVAGLFDSSLVPWLVSVGLDAKGEPDEVAGIRENAYLSALKLMTREQVATVAKLGKASVVGDDGKPKAVEVAYAAEHASARALVERCDRRVDCYIVEVGKQQREKSERLVPIKAAYMLGVIGNADARDALIAAASGQDDSAVRFIAWRVVDRLTPRADATLADRLDRIATQAADGKSPPDKSTLQTIATRIRIREP